MRQFNYYDPDVKLGRIQVVWHDGTNEIHESLVVDPQRDMVRRRLNGAGLLEVTDEWVDRVIEVSETMTAVSR